MRTTLYLSISCRKNVFLLENLNKNTFLLHEMDKWTVVLMSIKWLNKIEWPLAPPFKKTSSSVDFEKVKGGHYQKEILILNSFSFEDKDPRFTRIKPGLALRLPSKGLFYIKAIITSQSVIYWRIRKILKLQPPSSCVRDHP